jgi:hypothetical protein
MNPREICRYCGTQRLTNPDLHCPGCGASDWIVQTPKGSKTLSEVKEAVTTAMTGSGTKWQRISETEWHRQSKYWEEKLTLLTRSWFNHCPECNDRRYRVGRWQRKRSKHYEHRWERESYRYYYCYTCNSLSRLANCTGDDAGEIGEFIRTY